MQHYILLLIIRHSRLGLQFAAEVSPWYIVRLSQSASWRLLFSRILCQFSLFSCSFRSDALAVSVTCLLYLMSDCCLLILTWCRYTTCFCISQRVCLKATLSDRHIYWVNKLWKLHVYPRLCVRAENILFARNHSLVRGPFSIIVLCGVNSMVVHHKWKHPVCWGGWKSCCGMLLLLDELIWGLSCFWSRHEGRTEGFG